MKKNIPPPPLQSSSAKKTSTSSSSKQQVVLKKQNSATSSSSSNKLAFSSTSSNSIKGSTNSKNVVVSPSSSSSEILKKQKSTLSLSKSVEKAKDFSSSSLPFAKLPSDIIIHIIDFLASDCTTLKISSNNLTNILNFRKLCKEWFGRFASDRSIKMVFRYERVETVNLEEISFLYGAQRRFHSLNNQFWDNMILKSLVSIKNIPKSTKVNPIMEKKKREAMIIKKMIKFREENSTVCNGIQNLDFYEINTCYPIILKCFEIFPNFEYLRFAYFGEMEYGFYANLDWDLKSNKLAISSLEKSNKKCKSIECINVKLPCFIHKDFQHVFPNLESYHVKRPTAVFDSEFGSFPNLKTFYHKCTVHLEDWEQMHMPKFLKSIGNCPNITELSLKSDELIPKDCELFPILQARLPKLVHLDLYNTSVGNVNGIENLNYLNLKHLAMCSLCYSLPKSLEYLKVSIGISAKDIEKYMVVIPNLKTLIVKCYSKSDCLEKLVQFTTLEHLEMSFDEFSKRDLVEIKKHEDFLKKHLPNLKHLVVKGMN